MIEQYKTGGWLRAAEAHLRERDLVPVAENAVKHLTDCLAFDEHTDALAVNDRSGHREQNDVNEANVLWLLVAFPVGNPKARERVFADCRSDATEDVFRA